MRDHSGLLEGLQASIAELMTSERWTQFLDVQSRFYSYSPNNVILIQLQNPYATRVAGYKAWQALDHRVMAKESALRILAPMRYKSDDVHADDHAHEISHALLHDPESATTKDLTRGLKELEAESTAYVICTALGMDTSDYSFGYVIGWTGGAPEAIEGIKASTERIQRAATAVFKTFEVQEPVVETPSVVSADFSIEQRRDVKAVLDAGDLDAIDLEATYGL